MRIEGWRWFVDVCCSRQMGFYLTAGWGHGHDKYGYPEWKHSIRFGFIRGLLPWRWSFWVR